MKAEIGHHVGKHVQYTGSITLLLEPEDMDVEFHALYNQIISFAKNHNAEIKEIIKPVYFPRTEYMNDLVEKQQLEKEAQDMFNTFYAVAGNDTHSATDNKAVWNCVSLAVLGMVKENESVLEMAKLHMDGRATLVISSRLSKLAKLTKLVHDKVI